MINNDTWIECKKELPLIDGTYLICNTPDDMDIALYDGFGFAFNGRYRKPKYWKEYKPLIKKYGKQTETP